MAVVGLVAKGACVRSLLLFSAVVVATFFCLAGARADAAPYGYDAQASEEITAGAPGGALQEPWSPTFDAAGSLYVIDARGNGGKAVIDKYDSSNAFQVQLGAGIFSGEFTRSAAVNSETGHLYAGQTEFLVEPTVGELIVLGAAGEELSRWNGAGTPAKSFGEGCCFLYAAVDNSPSAAKGDVYVANSNSGNGEVDVLEPQNEDKEEGKFVRQLEAPPEGFLFNGVGYLAVDQTNGRVYVVDTGHKTIDRYSPSGELEAQLTGATGEPFKEPLAVAVDSASGDLFVIDHGNGNGGVEAIDKLSPTGELLAQITQTGPKQPLGRPVGLAVQQTGPHAGALYVADAQKKAVDVFTEEQPGAPTVDIVGVQQVGERSASFAGSINPHGTPTEYRFEYGPCVEGTCASSPYTTSVPAPDASLGFDDFAAHATSSVQVQGLSPGASYHVRLVAHNIHGEVSSEGSIFTTQGPSTAFALPDGRSWELVSPPDKLAASLSPPSELGVIQAATDGSAITYIANGATEASPPGAAGSMQVLSTRGPAGWLSRNIATPHEAATGDNQGTAPEYRFFSQELSTAVVQPFGLFNPALSEEASEQTSYLRTLGSCTSNCFRPLVTGKAGFANVPSGTKFGEELPCEEDNGLSTAVRAVCGPLFQGASSDGSHFVLRSTAPLIAGVPRNELYEWAGGQLSLVSVLPPNEAGEELPAPTGPALESQPVLGSKFGLIRGAARRPISDDGARVFFESGEKLYVRDTTLGKSLQLDAPEPGCGEGECESGQARYQIASADGSRVYFTDARRLTKDAGARTAEPDLFECKISVTSEGGLSCALSDLTPSEGGEAANVQGDVLGAGDDGGEIFFVADGALGTSGAQRGECVNNNESEPQSEGAQCNLFERRDGQGTRLVSVLSGGDATDWTQAGEHQPTRVSPDGRYLSFLSERPLTGYDSTDANSGMPDAELFLYDGAGAGRLKCASCDPSGARPVGVEYQALVSGASEVLPSVRGEWESEGWVAALPPPTAAIGVHQPTRQSNYLSNSGRLYFNALDALVPQDSNGTGDVYEAEPDGVGSCTLPDGCVSMISSGESPETSAFLDASESGDDVFFMTAQRLIPSQDIDLRRDVYDAHVCSSASPCFTPSPPSSSACASESSCKAPAAGESPVFGAPASSALSGLGNFAPPSPAKPKPTTRAELLAKALSSCRKRYPHSNKRRGSCERQARAKYGSTKKKKKKTGKKISHAKAKTKRKGPR